MSCHESVQRSFLEQGREDAIPLLDRSIISRKYVLLESRRSRDLSTRYKKLSGWG